MATTPRREQTCLKRGPLWHKKQSPYIEILFPNAFQNSFSTCVEIAIVAWFKREYVAIFAIRAVNIHSSAGFAAWERVTTRGSDPA